MWECYRKRARFALISSKWWLYRCTFPWVHKKEVMVLLSIWMHLLSLFLWNFSCSLVPCTFFPWFLSPWFLEYLLSWSHIAFGLLIGGRNMDFLFWHLSMLIICGYLTWFLASWASLNWAKCSTELLWLFQVW